MKDKTKIVIGWLVVVALLLVVIYKASGSLPLSLGSVIEGNAYYSTTTNAVITSNPLIKNGSGTLGSIVITKAGTGAFALYDATTTDVNKRTGQAPTSTIALAIIPASPTVGTYVFDSVFNTALIADFSNTMGTSTITWR